MKEGRDIQFQEKVFTMVPHMANQNFENVNLIPDTWVEILFLPESYAISNISGFYSQ